MQYRVLIVDDSTFYRKRLTSFLEQDPSIQVVGHAANGIEAIEKAVELKPDVITMDVEMPIMDGISAVVKIMEKAPTAILMLSSLTHEGAQATLDALDAGAADYIPKNFDHISATRPEAILFIQRRVKALARSRAFHLREKSALKANSFVAPAMRETKQVTLPVATSVGLSDPQASQLTPSTKRYQLLLIGASTGGPVALQKIVSELPANFPYPVILIQHMPGTFTATFAQRLNKYSALKVKLAEDNERLEKGTVYLAEGGKQLQVSGKGAFSKLKVFSVPTEREIIYHPSIDFTMESLVSSYSGDVLSIILTGMGSDGAKGCKLLKAKGATIWAQDEKSSVVYGMPKAVVESGSCDRVIPIDDIAKHIINEMKM